MGLTNKEVIAVVGATGEAPSYAPFEPAINSRYAH